MFVIDFMMNLCLGEHVGLWLWASFVSDRIGGPANEDSPLFRTASDPPGMSDSIEIAVCVVARHIGDLALETGNLPLGFRTADAVIILQALGQLLPLATNQIQISTGQPAPVAL